MNRSGVLAGWIAIAASMPAAAGGSGIVLPTLDAPRWVTRIELDYPSAIGRSLASNWAVEATLAPLARRSG